MFARGELRHGVNPEIEDASHAPLILFSVFPPSYLGVLCGTAPNRSFHHF
jgi:hypothetical protein